MKRKSRLSTSSPKGQFVPIEFPYKIKQSRYTQQIFSPYVELKIRTKEGKFVSHRFIFDTGADFTSLPKYMAEVVGINLEKSPQEVMYTANNEPMTTYHAKVKICFGEEILNLPCVFTDKDDTPFLLGRVGFIDKYTIVLDGKKKKLIFKKV